jgi:hypothetical protein
MLCPSPLEEFSEGRLLLALAWTPVGAVPQQQGHFMCHDKPMSVLLLWKKLSRIGWGRGIIPAFSSMKTTILMPSFLLFSFGRIF